MPFKKRRSDVRDLKDNLTGDNNSNPIIVSSSFPIRTLSSEQIFFLYHSRLSRHQCSQTQTLEQLMSDISHFELRSPSNFFVLSRRTAFVPWYGDLIDLDVSSIRHDSEKHPFLSWTIMCATSDLRFWPLAIRSSVSRLGWGCRWTFESTLTGQKLRRIQESIQVLRRDDLMSGRCRECRDSVRVSVRSHKTSTTSPVRQISSKKIPVIPDKGTRAAHQMRQFLICSWFDNYVWEFFMEEQIDVVFLKTTTGQKSREVSSMVTILHVVDIQSLTRTSVIGKKEHGQACGSIPPELSRGARQTQSCT